MIQEIEESQIEEKEEINERKEKDEEEKEKHNEIEVKDRNDQDGKDQDANGHVGSDQEEEEILSQVILSLCNFSI